ncbi:MAG: mechanosensitive ion channel family protein [Gammaproteobacteria bacterium]|nr:mechanosensitive ion channel family protein [Gammaproteobacteria bacterium]
MFSGNLLAQNSPQSNQLQDLEKELAQINDLLSKPYIAEDKLDQFRKDSITLKSQVSLHKDEILKSVTNILNQLESLGEPLTKESADVSRSRKELTLQKEELNRLLARYRLMSIRAEEQFQKINNLQRAMLTQRLLNKGPLITTLLKDSLNDGENSLKATLEFAINNIGANVVTLTNLIWIALIIIVFSIAGRWTKKFIRQWVSSRVWGNRLADRCFEALLVTTARYSSYLLVTTLLAAYTYSSVFSTVRPIPFLAMVAYGLPVLTLCLFLIELFFTPRSSTAIFKQIDSRTGPVLARRFRLLAVASFIGYVFLSAIYQQSQLAHALLLAKDVYAIMLICLIIWVVVAFSQITNNKKSKKIRFLYLLVLAFVLVAYLGGYRNLSYIVFRVFFSIGITYGIFLLAHKLCSDFFQALDQGKNTWHRHVRRAFGLKADQQIPGITGIRAIVIISIWLTFAYLVTKILGLSDDITEYINRAAIEGFTVGSLNINPARILFAGVVFAVLITISGWFKARLDKKWLSRSKLEKGVREALIIGSGYIGIIISVLVALSIAGFTFTNLAIIAGALSVGIGFGLQNIVNNFVSGLILLFERPIKKGDWIIVGNTEGYVKNISIRSTQIQTFDMADVIVPNSDLISNQVTNWMLYDNSGRIRVPIGVAYGSDTEKVKQILLDIASSHEKVVKNNPDRKIRVLFMSFGDSSLNFELRCHIANIDESLSTKSDINFAIDKAFRENNIEIPFPQRDVYIKHHSENKPPENKR